MYNNPGVGSGNGGGNGKLIHCSIEDLDRIANSDKLLISWPDLIPNQFRKNDRHCSHFSPRGNDMHTTPKVEYPEPQDWSGREAEIFGHRYIVHLNKSGERGRYKLISDTGSSIYWMNDKGELIKKNGMLTNIPVMWVDNIGRDIVHPQLGKRTLTGIKGNFYIFDVPHAVEEDSQFGMTHTMTIFDREKQTTHGKASWADDCLEHKGTVSGRMQEIPEKPRLREWWEPPVKPEDSNCDCGAWAVPGCPHSEKCPEWQPLFKSDSEVAMQEKGNTTDYITDKDRQGIFDKSFCETNRENEINRLKKTIARATRSLRILEKK